MKKIFFIFAITLFTSPIFAVAKKKNCQGFNPDIGCITKTPVKDIMTGVVSRPSALSVSPINLNNDNLTDLLIEGDGGNGGSQIYIYLQEKKGLYTFKGQTFAHSIYFSDWVIYAPSKSGWCHHLVEKLEYQNGEYKSVGSFRWTCVSETDPKSKFKISELKGTWTDSRIKNGFTDHFNETHDGLEKMLGRQVAFPVQVDANLRLKMD